MLNTGAVHPQAAKLNRLLSENNPFLYELLSDKGRAIYFPKDGILAQTAQAAGSRFNATIGVALNDQGTPLHLDAISEKIKLPPRDVFSYAPSFGKPQLREKWLELIKKKNPSLKSLTSKPVVTAALTHALSITGYLFVNPGDRIILSDKYWGNYRLIFENAYGAKLATFNTFKNGNFDIDSFNKILSDSIEDKIIVLFNFPNNPAGYTPTIEEAKQLTAILKRKADEGKKILAILDDAYFGLVYEKGVLTESLFPFLANLSENLLAVKLDGVTKEEYAWGFRVGFITYGGKSISLDSYGALEDKTAGAIRGSISNASHLSQSLVLAGLSDKNYNQEKKEKYNLLKERYEKVKEQFEKKAFQKFFTPQPFNSGYFMCVKLEKGLDGEKVRQLLLEAYSTGVIAIKNILRIAYSSVATNDIPALFENIYLACRETA